MCKSERQSPSHIRMAGWILAGREHFASVPAWAVNHEISGMITEEGQTSKD
jgi:hypothetical protein